MVGKLWQGEHWTAVQDSFAWKVHALFQHGHLRQEAFVGGKCLLSWPSPPPLYHIVARLGLPLEPLDLKDLVDVVKASLAGEDLRECMLLPHVILHLLDLIPVVPLLVGA